MEAKILTNSISSSDSSVNLTQKLSEINYSELIPVQFRFGEQLVDARTLHKALDSKQNFRDWIKDRIKRCDLIEEEDYAVIEYDYTGCIINDGVHRNLLSDNQYVAKRDYALKIDAAKEICMVENNDKGKAIRRYFIKCEKELKERIPKSYPEALRALADMEEKRIEAEKAAYASNMKALAEYRRAEQERKEKEQAVKTLESKKSDIEFSESFVSPDENDMLIREVAKKLEQNDIIIAEKSLREFLQETKFLTKRVTAKGWELTVNVINKGYAHYRNYYIDQYNNNEKVFTQTIYVTGKGYKRIVEIIKNNDKWRNVFLKYGKIKK